jgi:peptidylprolyl isomerase
MREKILTLLSGILMITVIVTSVSGCGPKQAETGDTVKVHYSVRLQDGEVVDSSANGEPLQIALGQEQVIPGFEQAVLGMKVGDTKTVTIPVDQAYGAYRDDLVREVGKEELPEGLELEVGLQLQANQPDGTVLVFTITEISDDTITLDGNHPLAGQDLTFDIELVEIVKSASKKVGTSLSSMTLGEALSSGKVTLAEFGSNTCIPCKQMKPILEDLAAIYEDTVNVLLVEVYDNMELTRQYEILGIPTQILFDQYGREVTRHTGVWAMNDIILQLKKIGID